MKIKTFFKIHKSWILILLPLLIIPLSWIFLCGDFKLDKYTFTTEWYKIVFSTTGMGIVVHLLHNKLKENKTNHQIQMLINEQRNIASKIIEDHENQSKLISLIQSFKLNHSRMTGFGISLDYFTVDNPEDIIAEMNYYIKYISVNPNKCANAKKRIVDACQNFSKNDSERN